MRRMQILVIIFVILVLSLSSIGYIFYVFPNLCIGNDSFAGNIGSSFGIFNACAMVFVSLTLIFQINEFMASRKEQNRNIQLTKNLFLGQIDYSYNQILYNDNNNRIKYHINLFQEYKLKYHKIISKLKVTSGADGVEIDLVTNDLKEIFLSEINHYRKEFKITFDVESNEFFLKEKGDNESAIQYLSYVLNEISAKLIEIDETISNIYFDYLKKLKTSIKNNA